MITLRLEDKVIELNTHDVGGQILYKAQDLLSGYGYEGRQVGGTLHNWKVSMETKGIHDFHVSVRGGIAQGTYLTKRNLLKLSAYVSADFEDAVFEAFEALSEGRVEDAIEVTAKVINVHEATLMGRCKRRVDGFLGHYNDIAEGVHAWIRAMANNTQANYVDKKRTLASVRSAVDESYDALSARNISGAAQHEAALKLIAEEERRLSRIETAKAKRSK